MINTRVHGRHWCLIFFAVLFLSGYAKPPVDSTPPEIRVQFPPKYPEDMKLARKSGKVIVEFVVSADGKTQNLVVVKSSNKSFEAAALAAVAKWLFKPGRVNGQRVNSRAQVALVFDPTDAAPPPPTILPVR